MKKINNMLDLTENPRNVRVRKRPVEVKVKFALEAGTLKTLEGVVHYDAGAALLSVSHGNCWPVERAKFDATYEPTQSTVDGQDGTYRKLPIDVIAIQLEEDTAILAGPQADKLIGQSGDWLVQYKQGSFGIVAKAIFDETYEVLGKADSYD